MKVRFLASLSLILLLLSVGYAEAFSPWMSPSFTSVTPPTGSQQKQINKVNPHPSAALKLPCPEELTHMDAAKSVMDKKNGLYRDACKLYNGWYDLMAKNDVCLRSFGETYPRLDCDQLVAGMCQAYNQQYQTTLEKWLVPSLQLDICDYTLYLTACGPTNDLATKCDTFSCPQKCHVKFDCSVGGFKQEMGAVPNNQAYWDQMTSCWQRNGL